MRRPKFIVSRRRAALFVVLGYIGIVAFAALLFGSGSHREPARTRSPRPEAPAPEVG